MPDVNRPATNDATERQVGLRLTWQASAKNKFSVYHENHWRCQCRIASSTVSWESASNLEYPLNSFSHVFLDLAADQQDSVGGPSRVSPRALRLLQDSADSPIMNLIPVIETAGLIPGLLYRGDGLQTDFQPFQTLYGRLIPVSVSASYVTGSHALKVGFDQHLRLARLVGGRQQLPPDLPLHQRRAEPAHRAVDAAPACRTAEVRPRDSSCRTNGRAAADAQRRHPLRLLRVLRHRRRSRDRWPWPPIGTSTSIRRRLRTGRTSYRGWAHPTISSATARPP